MNKINKILIISTGYPEGKNIYNNMFIHNRVKNYIKDNISVEIFWFDSSFSKSEEYEYEKIKVKKGNVKSLQKVLKENNYQKIIIHFALKLMTKTILSTLDKKVPILIWVHGYEGSGWYRRLFSFNLKDIRGFLKYIKKNVSQILFMRELILKYSKKFDITFIFVSNWMKKILEIDTLCINKIKKYYIIPNVVENKIFKYNEKNENLRFNIINIRTYSSKKYACDITAKVIQKLSKKDYFEKLNITLYGDGKLFKKINDPLRKFKNVSINQKFLLPEEMNKEFEKNGIILMPTRQDSQGVTTCEGMMAGLVPITSNNSGVPEYINNDCGYLCNNTNQIVKAVEKLLENKEKFLEKSKKASKYISGKCSPEIVIKKELEIIKK